MKRYKLLKDTPAFKAGTECYIEEAGHMVPCRGISYTIVHKDQLEKNPNILDDWFEEIKTAEPLIETVDARHIVKLWSRTNLIPSNSNEIEVCQIGSPKGTITQFYSDGLYIQFFGRVAPDAIHGRCYTIDELCGEEEE